MEAKGNKEDTCVCFVRIFKDLHEHLGDKEAKNFIDLPWGSTTPDEEAQNHLNKLRDEQVPSTLSHNRIYKNELEWTESGVDPINNSNHKTYLENFCNQFYQIITELIDKGAKEQEESVVKKDPLLEEILQHLTFTRSHCESFHGREEILSEISGYIQQALKGSSNLQPLVIYGESGCGKTSVLAKSAFVFANSLLQKSNRGALVIRFLGTTADSSTIHKVLRNICQQLSRLYEQDIGLIPNDHDELVSYFHKLLSLANDQKPLVLFLDSLDQLSPSNNAHKLNWLPRTLPNHVAILVSTLPKEYNCLDTLKSMLSKDSKFIQVLPLTLEASREVLDSWLKSANRTITTDQREKVMEAFSHCSLPLYLKLIFGEVLRWKSYTPIESIKLEPTIPGMIHSLFERIEKQHGKTLVSHALGFITISKNGLGEAELEDLISLDDEILQDVFQYWLPPVRRLPPLLWTRIRNELGTYLTERETDGNLAVYWYHRQFIQTAKERYLMNSGTSNK